VFASSEYRAPIDHAIRRFKYESRPDFARALAALIPEPPLDLGRALLVPVPLHPTRLAERGYNQSALLARRLARRFDVALSPLALQRIVATERQAGLGVGERERNVLGAFAVRTGARVEGRPILLVDDVVTTGATARACIEALRRSGARPIAVLAIAMTQ
jgi:ComF family protein